MAEVTLHRLAEGEYEAALSWYLERSMRAAAGFEAAVDRAMQFLAQVPEAGTRCDERHRYWPLRRYPYGLVYRIDGEQLLVVAIPHDHQLPGFWVERE